jgi:hypothetical protein
MDKSGFAESRKKESTELKDEGGGYSRRRRRAELAHEDLPRFDVPVQDRSIGGSWMNGESKPWRSQVYGRVRSSRMP